MKSVETDPLDFDDRPGYIEQRQELLSKDFDQAFDASVHLSGKEITANEKLVSLRDSMLNYYNTLGYFPPAKDFYKSKDHIKSTSLFGLLRQMPKGGFLHMHASAVKDFYWLIDKVISLPEMYVYWADEGEKYTKGELEAYNIGQSPEGFVRVAELAEASGSFRQEMYDLLTLTTETDQDTMYIWAEFDKVFQRIGKAYAYQPIFEEFHRAVLLSLLDDNIQHVELREIMFGGLYDLDHPSGYYNEDSIVQIFKKLEADLQKDHPKFSLKLIYTDLRFRDRAAIAKSFTAAYALRAQYPEIIKGFDLVAHEDAGNGTMHYLNAWLKSDSLERAHGIDMPFYFHDGESSWYSNKNLYDAVLLGSKRIGHGLNLELFPSLIEQVIEQDICLEVSPISNQVLGYVEDLRMHPANALIRKGVQITISSDDPAIYQYEGLTYDYWSILLAWQLDLRSLKKLSMNGILYSTLTDDEKSTAMGYWEADWKEFIDIILTEI
ncbi:MAG: hypothetical protein RIF33_24390 [Cyclobacteriaceae bacterium]